MSASDVIAVAQWAPTSTVVAVHMEAINHCGLAREDLRTQLKATGLDRRILVPNDGERLELECPDRCIPT